MSQDKVAKTFDEWVETGAAQGLEEGHKDVVEQVIAAMELKPGEKVLDLGCGSGWATRLIAQANAGVQAIGVDASARMIALADELHSFTIRARYDFGSFEELEFKDADFDRVFSMEALYYSSNLEKAVSEALRVLKPGGRMETLLDFYTDSPASEGWDEKLDLPLHRKSESEWAAFFQDAGFGDVTTSRVIDRRGPGRGKASEDDEDWGDRKALHEAGTLWIRATKS